MTRLIDADALKADIEQFNRPLCDDYHMKHYVLNQIITDIENQPTVDAVPVRHGKWKLIRMEDNGDGFYTCSNCDRGDIHSPLVNVPYCWYCGARMDEE